MNINREYPRWKYHASGKRCIVENADAEAELGGGWADTPAAFDAYNGPRPAPTDPQVSLKWVDEWLPGLPSHLRNRIKGAVLRAHTAFLRQPDDALAYVHSMRQAFYGIAKAVFEAGILTAPLLETEIPLLVWDSAVAGGWWRYASETRTDLFPEQRGHYWFWRDKNHDWRRLFSAETAEWLSQLLEASAELRAAPTPRPEPTIAIEAAPPPEQADRMSLALTRQAVVLPILQSKRWTPYKWATKAGVNKNSVYEYVKGKRRLTKANRAAMAEELGLTCEQLPD